LKSHSLSLGQELFKANKFIEAFQITADAYYRYPPKMMISREIVRLRLSML